MTTELQRYFKSFAPAQRRDLEIFFNIVFPTLDIDTVMDITGDVTGDLTGNVTGNVTGDVVGDLTGNVAGNVVGDVTGNVTGYPTQLKNGTPVNAVAATGTLTLSGVVIDGETVTIDGVTYEYDTDGNVTGGNTQVDISGSASASEGTLTISGVALDAETVVINSRTYEFDARESEHISGDVRINISETAGYSTRSQATITFANGDIHNDAVVIQGNTHTLKADGTADSATVCDITGAATIAAGTMVMTLGGVPSDTETFTIDGRVYEFDPGDNGITGDVEIDTNGLATIDLVGAQIQTDYNADGSRVADAVYDSANNTVTFTARTAGVASNYVCSETMADCGISGNFTGGADALATEIGPIFLAHLQAAGAETNITPSAGGTADKVVLTWDIGGVAGDAVTLTETLTAGSCDGGGTFGGTTAGVDCTAADAVTAVVAAITADAANIPVSAADGAGDTVVLTHDIPGTAGDLVTTTETMSNGAFDDATLGTTTAGVDCPAADADGPLIAADAGALSTLSQGAGTTVTVTADTKGTAGNAIATTETMANGAFGAATLESGVDGTVGAQWDVLVDDSYIYVAVAANTVADGNWERAAIASF